MDLTAILGSALVGGVSNVLSGVFKSEDAKREAQYLNQMMADIEKSGKNRIEAIGLVYNTASDSMKSSMETQVNLAVDEIQDSFQKAYKSLEDQQKEAGDYFTEAGKARREAFAKSRESMEASLSDSRQLMTNSFAQARMGQSGAFVDAMMKSQKLQVEKQKEMDADQLQFENEITKNFSKALSDIAQRKEDLTTAEGKQISNTRVSAGANISSMIANLMMQKANAQDQIQAQMDDRLATLGDAKRRADDASVYDFGNFAKDFFMGGVLPAGGQLVKDMMAPAAGGTDIGKRVPNGAPPAPVPVANNAPAQPNVYSGLGNTSGGVQPNVYVPNGLQAGENTGKDMASWASREMDIFNNSYQPPRKTAIDPTSNIGSENPAK